MRTLSADFLKAMSNSSIQNYVIPGLTSRLIVPPTEKGCIRLFECERDHQENVIPHSHRFDFECLVVKGTIQSHVWTKLFAYSPAQEGDEYLESTLSYNGNVGDYTIARNEVARYKKVTTIYPEGSAYGMKAQEIHSINFSKGAVVLFFEGPKIYNLSRIIEPYVNGQHIETFKIQPWMFQKE